MLYVKDVLTRHVITTGLDTPVREICEMMKTKKIGSVFITDKAGKMVGIITESTASPTSPGPRRSCRRPCSRWTSRSPCTGPRR
jgi:CBS-domain-containing membrane protein